MRRAIISSRCSEIGATDLNGTTWFDRTNYFETVPTRRARPRPVPGKRPHGPSARRGRPRRSSITSAASSRTRSARATTSPTAWSNMPSSTALFPAGHPYRHSTIGSMADLDAASLDDVQDWFREHYGPNNAVLVLAGDIDAADGAAAGRALFRRHPARPGEQSGRGAACRRCPRRSTEVMHDRVANTRLYRDWAVPGLTDRRQRRRSTSAPTCSAASPARGSTMRWSAASRSRSRVTASVQPFQRVSMFEVTVDVKPGQ